MCIDFIVLTKLISVFDEKAFVGFSLPASSVAIASGKWGCGAFNGDPILKAVIQLLAASEAGRDLVYFTFGDMGVQETVVRIYELIKDMPISKYKLFSIFVRL